MCACYKRVYISKSTCICIRMRLCFKKNECVLCMYVCESNKMCVRACCGMHCHCLPFDCSSAFCPPRAAPAATLFTADCAVVPAALTNERPIILWGVSSLMGTAAAHSPADDLAPPSEGAGGGWKKNSRLPSKFMWVETAAAGVLSSPIAAARSSCRRGSKGGVNSPFPSSSSIIHLNETVFGMPA